jgi:hypothetical protein
MIVKVLTRLFRKTLILKISFKIELKHILQKRLENPVIFMTNKKQ